MSIQSIQRIEQDLQRQKSLSMHADTRAELKTANMWVEQLEYELSRAIDIHNDDAER